MDPRHHIVALTPAGHREVLCIVHGAGGLTLAGPGALQALQHRIERAAELPSASRPFDDGTAPVYLVHTARGSICTTVSLIGARVREATPADLEVYAARCRAHRASADFERAAYDGGGHVPLDVAAAMADALDRGDERGFAWLSCMNPHPARAVEASSA